MITDEERCSCLAARRTLSVVAPSNAPGLRALAYRIGRYNDFKERLLAGLSSAAHPELAGLQTRSDDDFSVALLDAFACMADVLTFYQERIANESYLWTATERRSVLALARLSGYRPSPGVAAAVELAFTLEDAPGAAEPPVLETTIPVGTQVRSIPGPSESAQTSETVKPITAHHGSKAPEPAITQAQTFETVEPITARYEWNALEPVTTELQSIGDKTKRVWIEGANRNVQVGQGLLLRPAGGEDIFRTIVGVHPDTVHGLTRIDLSAEIGTELEIATLECNLLQQRAAVFGHNAPNPCLLHINGPVAGRIYNETDCEWTGRWMLWSGERKLDLDATYTGIAQGSYCVLVTPDYYKIFQIDKLSEVSLSEFALSSKVTRLTLSDVSSSKTSSAHVLDASLTNTSNAHPPHGFDRRETSVYLQPESLTLSKTKPRVAEDLINRSKFEVQGPLKALPPKGQRGVLLEDDGKGGWALREMITIQRCEVNPDRKNVLLTLTEPLAGSYRPAQVRINLNIARATHGETVEEILGNGDARMPSQRFALKQRPLTYIPSETPAGAESTLEVRVDDLLWTECESFIEAGPRDRVYTQSIADDGTVTLAFGDGINGARLPSGQSNVRARYRKGTGLGGLVGAKQLSVLMGRPWGVKAVVNPEPAADAEEPETLETARTTAPVRVLTLDRVVSLQDYADYARTFPGIAKARADVHPTQPQTVFVTVAGSKGAAIAQGSELAKRLGKAFLQWGNPYLTVQVRSYRPAWFELTVRIERLPDALGERVAGAVRTGLAEAFCFERAVLGGRIWRSELFAMIQRVPGVAAVDIERFTRKPQPAHLQNISHAVPDYAVAQDQATAAFATTELDQWPFGTQASLDLSRLRGNVADSLTASPADPHKGLGAELLILHPASLKLEVVDAL